MQRIDVLMNQKIQFGREDTKAIKGISVLMMLFCHLVASPDRYPAGFEGFQSIIPGFVDNYLIKIGLECGLLCVPFFFFLGGYGLYLRMQKNNFSLKDSILKLYYSYWKIFFLFVPIGLIFFAREGVDISSYTTRFSQYRGLELITVLISDFTGLSCKFNGEWWFFGEYVCIMPLGYLFIKGTRKIRDFWADFMLVLGIDFFIRGIVPVLPDLPLFINIRDNFLYTNFMRFNTLCVAFFAGIIMAKHNGICKIKELIQGVPFRTIISLVAFGALVILRMYVVGPNLDVVICSIMICLLSVVLDKLTVLKKIFVFFSKHSTNMWLTHGFFCFYFLEFTRIVYCTRNILVDFSILIILSVAASMFTDAVYNTAGKLYHQLKNRNKK